MNENQQIVFLNSQIACAMIRAMGMQADNEIQKLRGEYPKFTGVDFERLIEETGIGHNAVLETLKGKQ